jgi:hypothetical protein
MGSCWSGWGIDKPCSRSTIQPRQKLIPQIVVTLKRTVHDLHFCDAKVRSQLTRGRPAVVLIESTFGLATASALCQPLLQAHCLQK